MLGFCLMQQDAKAMTGERFDSKAYALVKAVCAKDAQAVKDALQNGVDANWRDSDGKTLLHHAVETGDAVIIDALLRHGADMLSRDVKERVPSALGLAASRGMEETVKAFIAAGAKPQMAENALNLAAENGHAGTVKILLEAGFDVDFLPTAGRTPLMIAASNDDIAMMETLLEKGADPNAKDMRNFTALHWAALMGKAGGVKSLVEQGADETIKNIYGYTPAMTAAEYGYSKVAALLDDALNIRKAFAEAARKQAEAQEKAQRLEREEALGVFSKGTDRPLHGAQHPASFKKYKAL